jgi:hypothetical protein
MKRSALALFFAVDFAIVAAFVLFMLVSRGSPGPAIVGLFVLANVLLTAAFAYQALKRHGGLPGLAGIDFAKLKAFTDSTQAMIREYMQANWSGGPETLPAALTALLSRLEAHAQSQGFPMERALLKSLMVRTIETQGLANGRDLREAIRQVA